MNMQLSANAGSFRDPVNRVYEVAGNGALRILRGVNRDALDRFRALCDEPFFRKMMDDGLVVRTRVLDDADPAAEGILAQGWAGVLEHDTVPFVSYPYEWTFSMLKDAALLQLRILETALEHGWTLKDATPFNIQFLGPRPVFIDIVSFEPWEKGEPWVGHRQFCAMFLTPLLLKAHLGLDHLGVLRANLDGVPPTEAAKYFRGLSRLKKGVLSHVVLPATVERSIARRERDAAPAAKRGHGGHSDAMVIGLVQSLSRLVGKLTHDVGHTDWSRYDQTHSYDDAEHAAKKAFVERHAAGKPRDHVWDIGCNTGTFSKICAEHCTQVIALDGDHDAVEQLYLRERDDPGSKILPIVMNLANISPNHGWGGAERLAFDRRKRPDLVLCLALIHHIRLSANIPNLMFLQWLRTLDADVILEFVNREDEMVEKLLTNKKERYEDYCRDQFVRECETLFTIRDSQPLKGGKREIFLLEPR